MRSVLFCLAMALPGLVAVGAHAFSGFPLNGLSETQPGNSLFHPVRGCHRDDQIHYDDSLAETTSHFHAGLSCAAIHAGEDRPPIKPHCHRGPEIHYHGEMNRSRWHQHSKIDCEPYLVEAPVAPNAKTCYDRGRTRICR